MLKCFFEQGPKKSNGGTVTSGSLPLAAGAFTVKGQMENFAERKQLYGCCNNDIYDLCLNFNAGLSR